MLSIQKNIGNATKRFVEASIFIQEGDYIVKTLTNDDEKTQAYRLRHRVFCEELGWVPINSASMEIDRYDQHAIFIGVFDNRHKLVAFSRLISPGTAFMIEKEFSSLIGSWHTIRKQDDTAEVSRLCVLPEARNSSIHGNFGIHSMSMFLYKGIYQWCVRNGVRYIYVVVENTIYRMFKAKGFPCRPVGEPLAMSDGCMAVAAMIDFRELILINTVKRPEFTKWFTRYQSTLSRLPQQQLELYSRPGASA